jgi:alpha-beta hydrolase superfamily lysophospholipase
MRTCGFICTASFYKEFYNNVSKIPNKKYDNLFNENYPILIVGGSDDLVSNRGKKLIALEEYYKKQSNKVTRTLYENDRHEILNEFDKDKVIEDIINWIKLVL